MLDRNAIAAAMQFALGRLPEEVAYKRCQLAFADIHGLIEDLVGSQEFKARSWHAAAAKCRTVVSERPFWRGDSSDLEWAYKTLLGRAPDSPSAIAAWAKLKPARSQVVEQFITSEEFKSKAWHAAAQVVRAKFATEKSHEPAVIRATA